MGARCLCRTFLLALALAALPGCTYLGNRGRDAAEMFDLGVTWSRKPQFGLYMNCPVIVPLGYGHVDGTYAGVGGGKVGVMAHKQRNTGLVLWGREHNSWDDTGGKAPQAMENQRVGILGLAQGDLAEQHYKPACKHYFHLGWVGVTANIRWLEIPDFFLGWTGLDISGDDLKRAAAPQPGDSGDTEADNGA